MVRKGTEVGSPGSSPPTQRRVSRARKGDLVLEVRVVASGLSALPLACWAVSRSLSLFVTQRVGAHLIIHKYLSNTSHVSALGTQP